MADRVFRTCDTSNSDGVALTINCAVETMFVKVKTEPSDNEDCEDIFQPDPTIGRVSEVPTQILPATNCPTEDAGEIISMSIRIKSEQPDEVNAYDDDNLSNYNIVDNIKTEMDTTERCDLHVPTQILPATNCATEDAGEIISMSIRIKSEPPDEVNSYDDGNLSNYNIVENIKTEVDTTERCDLREGDTSVTKQTSAPKNCNKPNLDGKNKSRRREGRSISTGNGTVRKRFTCFHCERTYPKLARLRVHMYVHTDERPIKCDRCDKRFKRKESMEIHVKLFHLRTKNRFSCNYCAKRFSSSGELKGHTRIHTNTRPYKCDHCDKRYTKKDILKTHIMRAHFPDSQRVFRCPHCEKTFNQRISLNHHINIHTGEKAFECAYCDKGFGVKHNLQKHISTVHCPDGSKPFVCPYCSKGFNQRSHVDIHVRVHTGEKPFKCSYCGKCFTQSSSLKTHVNSYHCSHHSLY